MVVIVGSYEFVEYDGLPEQEPLLEVGTLLSWASVLPIPSLIVSVVI